MFRLYRKLYSLLSRSERRRALLVCILLLLAAFSEAVGVASIMPFIAVLANPEFIETNTHLSQIYETLKFSSHQSFMIFLGVCFLGILLVSLFIKAVGVWAQLRFCHMRNYAWSSRLFEGYLGQPYEWFINRHSANLATTILAEVKQVVGGAFLPAMQIVAQCFIVIFLFGLLVVVDPLLAVSVGGVLGGIYGLISFVLAKRINKIGGERRLAQRQRFHVVQESFGGIKDIKVAGLENFMAAKYNGPAYLWAVRQIEAGVASQLPQFIMQGFLFGGMLLIILYLMASHGGFEEAMPIVALYAFAGYRLMPAMQNIYANLSTMRFNKPAVDSLCKDLSCINSSMKQETLESARLCPSLGLRNSLELHNASYCYPGASRPAVRNISIKIRARTTVALVGSTGAGKTTVVDILLGLLYPTAGALIADGQEITNERLHAWRHSLGYVPQQIFLADDTLAANIAFGVPREKIDNEKVKQAAAAANLSGFVESELPNGYDTPIGERGVRLSGGQRQRLGIARSLYRDPDVLILDEATSALDNITEQAVMDAVNNLGNRKTIILIAHRLSTVRGCDCIYLLDHGEVVAQGSYSELIADSSRFRKMADIA